MTEAFSAKKELIQYKQSFFSFPRSCFGYKQKTGGVFQVLSKKIVKILLKTNLVGLCGVLIIDFFVWFYMDI